MMEQKPFGIENVYFSKTSPSPVPGNEECDRLGDFSLDAPEILSLDYKRKLSYDNEDDVNFTPDYKLGCLGFNTM